MRGGGGVGEEATRTTSLSASSNIKVLFLHPERDVSLVPESKGWPIADSAVTPRFLVKHGKDLHWRVHGGLSPLREIPHGSRGRL